MRYVGTCLSQLQWLKLNTKILINTHTYVHTHAHIPTHTYIHTQLTSYKSTLWQTASQTHGNAAGAPGQFVISHFIKICCNYCFQTITHFLYFQNK